MEESNEGKICYCCDQEGILKVRASLYFGHQGQHNNWQPSTEFTLLEKIPLYTAVLLGVPIQEDVKLPCQSSLSLFSNGKAMDRSLLQDG